MVARAGGGRQRLVSKWCGVCVCGAVRGSSGWLLAGGPVAGPFELRYSTILYYLTTSTVLYCTVLVSLVKPPYCAWFPGRREGVVIRDPKRGGRAPARSCGQWTDGQRGSSASGGAVGSGKWCSGRWAVGGSCCNLYGPWPAALSPVPGKPVHRTTGRQGHRGRRWGMRAPPVEMP